MIKYALLRENTVVSVQDLSDEDLIAIIKDYQCAIDISGYLVTPTIGYVLNGNKLIPNANMIVTVKDMVKAKIKLYRAKAPELLVEVYATNTLSGMTTSQSDASFELMGDVIFALCEGAWPTAIYRLQKKADAGLITQEVANNWISTIQVAMV